MFDIMKAARNIREARIARNLTQMNLADAMEVSYQAVSNWERGNSMPDIAKLPQLCQILEISIDELLGAEREAKTISTIIQGEEILPAIPMEEIGELAPLLPPKDVKRLVSATLHSEDSGQQDAGEEKRKKCHSAIVGLAPFLGREDLEELLRKLESEMDLETITGLAPFLEHQSVDELVLRLADEVDPDELVCLAPFMSREGLDKLAWQLADREDPDELECFAPFISKESLDKLVLHLAGKSGLESVMGLVPHLSHKGIKGLLQHCLESWDLDEVMKLAPFMGKHTGT